MPQTKLRAIPARCTQSCRISGQLLKAVLSSRTNEPRGINRKLKRTLPNLVLNSSGPSPSPSSVHEMPLRLAAIKWPNSWMSMPTAVQTMSKRITILPNALMIKRASGRMDLRSLLRLSHVLLIKTHTVAGLLCFCEELLAGDEICKCLNDKNCPCKVVMNLRYHISDLRSQM